MNEIAEVRVAKLGLAAYMKMKGATLQSVQDRCFIFKSDRTLEDWEIEYANSCCARHDAELCALRKLYTKKS